MARDVVLLENTINRSICGVKKLKALLKFWMKPLVPDTSRITCMACGREGKILADAFRDGDTFRVYRWKCTHCTFQWNIDWGTGEFSYRWRMGNVRQKMGDLKQFHKWIIVPKGCLFVLDKKG